MGTLTRVVTWACVSTFKTAVAKKAANSPGGKMKANLFYPFVVLVLWLSLDSAMAVEFEKMGSAISQALGTTKAFKTTVQTKKGATDVFYSKDGAGKAEKFAVVQKRLYDPNCTHTWVVGINAKTVNVETVRVVEMSCPHAFPTQKKAYLEQYKGRGPASLKTLTGDIHTIAKATGSSQLTTDAVSTAIEAAQSLKGKI